MVVFGFQSKDLLISSTDIVQGNGPRPCNSIQDIKQGLSFISVDRIFRHFGRHCPMAGSPFKPCHKHRGAHASPLPQLPIQPSPDATGHNALRVRRLKLRKTLLICEDRNGMLKRYKVIKREVINEYETTLTFAKSRSSTGILLSFEI